MKKTAFLFPGQGSQSVGMGLDLYQEYDEVRELFDMAEDISKTYLSRLCFKGPMEDLTRTVVLQPCVTLVNLACLAAIRKESITPHVTAGHSLGEYAALACAGVLAPEDALSLVDTRGRLMHRESEKYRGAMSVVMGLGIDRVSEVVQAVDAQKHFPQCVTVANHNDEKQIVISGDPESVSEAANEIKALRGRCIPLKVSGAWHSPLIKGAESEFEEALSKSPFKTPECPVVFNVTAETADAPNEIRTLMRDQLCSPVHWYDTMINMLEDGVECFVEVGPGSVLTGLIKRIVPDDFQGKIYTVSDMKSLELFFKDVI